MALYLESRNAGPLGLLVVKCLPLFLWHCLRSSLHTNAHTHTQHSVSLGSEKLWAHMSLLCKAMRQQCAIKEESRMKNWGREGERCDCSYHQGLSRLFVSHITHDPTTCSHHTLQSSSFQGRSALHMAVNLPSVCLQHSLMPCLLHTLAVDYRSSVKGDLLNIDLWPSANTGSASGHFH